MGQLKLARRFAVQRETEAVDRRDRAGETDGGNAVGGDWNGGHDPVIKRDALNGTGLFGERDRWDQQQETDCGSRIHANTNNTNGSPADVSDTQNATGVCGGGNRLRMAPRAKGALLCRGFSSKLRLPDGQRSVLLAVLGRMFPFASIIGNHLWRSAAAPRAVWRFLRTRAL